MAAGSVRPLPCLISQGEGGVARDSPWRPFLFHHGQVSDPPPQQLALLRDAAASLDEPQATVRIRG